MQEKIISLELTGNNDNEIPLNGNTKACDEDDLESEEPTTPTTVENNGVTDDITNVNNKKKKRKRSRKGKH